MASLKKAFIDLCYRIELKLLTKRIKKSLQHRGHNNGKNVLKSYLFVILPGDRRTTLVSLFLARGLIKAGSNVNFLICDGMPACELKTYLNQDIRKSGFASGQIDDFCKSCISPVHKQLSAEFPHNTHRLSYFERMSDSKLNKRINKAVEKSASSGAIRYNTHVKGIDDKYIDEDEQFIKSAHYSARALIQAIKQTNADAVISHHGIYVPMGVLPVICDELKIEYYSWNFAYKADHIIIGQGDTYHKTILKINEVELKKRISDDDLEDGKRLLDKKIAGSENWMTFYDQEKLAEKNEVGYTQSGYHLILTNVAWDAQIFDSDELPYESQYDWLFCIVSHVQKSQDIKVKIRVHPAEKTHPVKTRVTIRDVLTSRFPDLGDNIEILDEPNDPSSYDLMGGAICIHTYASKVAIEAAAFGYPVTISGEGWARNKNIGIDISQKDELLKIFSQRQFLVSDQRNKTVNALKFFLLLNDRMTIPLNLFNKNIFRKTILSKLFLLDYKKLFSTKDHDKRAANFFTGDDNASEI